MSQIKKVEIKNFKGISECTVDDLKPVNLFIGRNDCGKSSILEAVYSVCKEYLGPNLPNCITRRSNRPRFSPKEIWFGYDTTSDIKIDLEFENALTLGMSIIRDGDITQTVLRAPDWSETATKYDRDFAVYEGGERHYPPGAKNLINFLDKCTLLDFSIKHDVLAFEGKYLNQAKLSAPADSELADAYSKIYELGDNWEFVPHPDFPTDPSRVAILERDKRYFVDGFGDGVRYGIAICACAKTISDTALLIEEVESHQHPKALKQLVKKLLEISKENNLQLIISTHSFETFRYFYYSFDKKGRKEHFRCFHIIRDSTTGKVKASPTDNIQAITHDIFGIAR